ncbi:hypothetical protein MLD38_009630 [Melastoma candidum]|uniref:Uncharacterized protein n=1 Tax=Melastoma candidum TaxID=119954 RepID=A0ACB9RXU1_9MYRT|nr:hypothetical protein MLD38_009630 [Melastoma candidum]
MASAQFTNSRFVGDRSVLRPSYSSLSDSARRAPIKGKFGPGHAYASVVDSVSCRQMYLRSYTFSRKENVPEKTRKYIEGVKRKVSGARSGLMARKVRAKDDQASCSALFSAVARFLTCTSRIDGAIKDGRRYSY